MQGPVEGFAEATRDIIEDVAYGVAEWFECEPDDVPTGNFLLSLFIPINNVVSQFVDLNFCDVIIPGFLAPQGPENIFLQNLSCS
jgi:hypothetical protein